MINDYRYRLGAGGTLTIDTPANAPASGLVTAAPLLTPSSEI
jgi:hypothetical protein